MYQGPIINIHGHLRHGQDFDLRLAAWRKWGVRKFVCLCLHPRWSLKGYYTNEDFLQLAGRYREVVIGFGAVNLVAGQVDRPEAVDRLKEQGFAGIKCEDNSFPYNHEIYWPLYARMEALGMPALFHTGNVAPLELNDGINYEGRDGVDAENMRPYLLDRVARAFPKLTIVGAHLGLPHTFEAINLAQTRPNVFFDFSGGGGSRGHVNQILAALSPKLPGARLDDPADNFALPLFERKLLFGTDNPEPEVWVPASERIMDALAIPETARRRFYHDTAAEILGAAAE